MSLIEAPKLVSIKQKRKKEKRCRGWTDHFSIHCILDPLYSAQVEKPDRKILQTSQNQTKSIRKIAASEILRQFLICDFHIILTKFKISYHHIIKAHDTEKSFKNLLTIIDVRFLRLQFSVGFVSNLARSYMIRCRIFSDPY